MRSRNHTEVGCTSERRLLLWLFVAAQCALLLVHNGGLIGLDGETFYATARALVDQRRLDVGPGFNTTTGVGGLENAKGNLELPLLATVVYTLTLPVAWFASAHSDLIRSALVGASMTTITAGIVVAAYQLSRRLGARTTSALIAGVGAVAGTFLLPYSKEFFAEPLAALGIVFAIERTLAGQPAAAGAWLAVAVLARAQSILLVPLLLAVIFRSGGLAGALRAAWPVGIASC